MIFRQGFRPQTQESSLREDMVVQTNNHSNFAIEPEEVRASEIAYPSGGILDTRKHVVEFHIYDPENLFEFTDPTHPHSEE
jgi:hypothetical protein